MLNFEKEFNPELLLPVYKPEIDVQSELCAKAHRTLREAMRKADAHLANEGLELYSNAYGSGVPEAAVNALTFCVSMAANNALATKDSDGSTKRAATTAWKDLIHVLIEILFEVNHPVSVYYLALSLIYGFCEGGELTAKNESDFDVGWSLMLTLADRSNEYAENFVNFSVDFCLETVPAAKGEKIQILPPPIQVWGGLIYKIWE